MLDDKTMNEIKPTESELEILQVLWRLGKASVRQVHDEDRKSVV